MAESISVSSENIKSLLESKNGRISAARYEAEAAEERQGSLARSFLPSVELHGGTESFKTGNLARKTQPVYGGEARLNLFNSGRDKIESDLRNLEAEKRNYQAQRIQSEELEKARTIYWQIIYLREKQALLKATLELNGQNLSAAQRRIKSGVATDSDRFEFEMKAVDLKRELAQAEVQIRTQTTLLQLILGLGEKTRVSFNEPLTHDHKYESVIHHTVQQHDFLFKEAELKGEQYLLAAKGSRRAWWPKLDAYAGYNKYNERIESAGPDASNDMKSETVFGLKLTMSLSAGLESEREASALSKEGLAARELASYQRQEVEAHLEGEVAQLKLLHDQVHEAEQNIVRAERYYKMSQSEYSRGVKNSPDVLGASEKLFDMRHKRLEIIKDFQVSKSHILSKIGQ